MIKRSFSGHRSRELTSEMHRRRRGILRAMSVFPEASEFYCTLKKTMLKIQPGQRVRVVVPREISHSKGHRNYEVLEMIQMDFRCSLSNPDVFMVLRFDQNDESSEVVADVCHFTS